MGHNVVKAMMHVIKQRSNVGGVGEHGT